MTPWNLTNIAAWPLRNPLKFAGGSLKFRPIRQPCDAAKRNSRGTPSLLRRRAEAAAEARYLILLFAETSEARNPRRQELIAKVLDDLARLSD
jgi:hypothetical protein